MSCLVLWPAPVCGFNGVCASNNATCLCRSGFTQSREFNYYFTDEASSNGGLCFHHEVGFAFLYGLAAFASTLTFLFVLFDYRKNCKHGILMSTQTTLVSLFCYSVATIYRSFRPEEVFGISAFFTFFFANAIAFVSVTFHQNQVESFCSLLKRRRTRTYWSSTQARGYIRNMKKCEKVFTYWDLLVAQLLWISCLVPERTVSLILVRTFLTAVILRELQFLMFGLKFLRLYRQGLERLARIRNNLDKEQKLSDNKEAEKWMRRHKKSIQRLHSELIVYAQAGLINFVLPLFWDLWMVWWCSYLIPLGCVIWCAACLQAREKHAEQDEHQSRSRRDIRKVSLTSGVLSRLSTHIEETKSAVKIDVERNTDDDAAKCSNCNRNGYIPGNPVSENIAISDTTLFEEKTSPLDETNEGTQVFANYKQHETTLQNT